MSSMKKNALAENINSNSVSSSLLRKKATIHQVTTMLATSKNVLFPGHNSLLTTGTDDPSLAGDRAIIMTIKYFKCRVISTSG